LATNIAGRNGICPPNQIYKIYNYYCNPVTPVVEPTLGFGRSCQAVESVVALTECDSVEGFIETNTTTPPFNPVFYRCYWYSPDIAKNYETVAFEWSATSEYIEWYVKTIANPGLLNYVPQLIINAGGTPPVTSVGYLVPLLKVTNHSPSLF
jgi:hypothetical protein